MTVTITQRRVIDSSWVGTDITDHGYADETIEAIERGRAQRAPLRDPLRHDEDGQVSALSYVIGYTDPRTGEERWAQVHADDSGREYADHATAKEAEASFEENVRGLQPRITGAFDEEGNPERWWERSNVDGICARD